MGRQSCFHKFGVHAGQAVTVLDNHGGHLRVGEHPPELRPGSIHSRSNLCLDPLHRMAGLYRPLGEPSHLTVEVGLLVMGGHPCIEP